MSDSDANPAPRRSRTRPAMPQDAQSAPAPAAARRRTLRVDPFSVEPLSRPRRRSITPQETVKPARTRKRGRDEAEETVGSAGPEPSSTRRRRKADAGSADEPKVTTTEAPVADGDKADPGKKRRRTRSKSSDGEDQTTTKRDSKVDDQDGEESKSGPRKRTRSRTKKPVAALPAAKSTPALPEPKKAIELEDSASEPQPKKPAADSGEDDTEAEGITRRHRRTRKTTGEETAAPTRKRRSRKRIKEEDEDSVQTTEASDDSEADDDEGGDGKRKRRPRRRKRKSGNDAASGSTRTSAKHGGRRQGAIMPAEVRNAIDVAPPRKMLVTRKDKTTQIAVLEARTLVEHYVTQSHEQSFVGNIYKGRVQNVLPGMEAAFVDIGKGRNGVLYAGEVLYDEADLDGEPVRIESQLKPGQTVIVQVTKDPMGTKGARLTQQLSLAGRFCVLSPFDTMLGISRKLPDGERERLRKILKGVRPEGYGLIVRTAAEGCTADQLIADVERLVNRWKRVEEKIEKAKALDMVYAEPDLVLRVIRDVFGSEHTDLIVDDVELADRIREYLGETSPEDVSKVQVFEKIGADGEPRNLFTDWQISAQVRRALETKVWLKSGGYLIIEKTEAMWVIDVNTGRFVGKDNLEETILKNNIEAAVEIARQLRLRDMGGIIVIDFVDMLVPAHRDEVLKRFKAELARDKTKTRVMDISKLGLVQMTRKNVSKGLMEVFTEPTDDVIPGRRLIKKLLED